MYDPRFRFTLLLVLIAFISVVGILFHYFFYKGLNLELYLIGVVNIGSSVAGGIIFIWICTKFITFSKNKITGFEATYIDETGTGFNFPVSLSKFIPEIIAPPYSIKGLSPLEAELIGFLNGYRSWPYDITGENKKSLYSHSIEQWNAMKKVKGAGPLHRAAALAQDLCLIYAYKENRKKYPYSQFWKRDKISFSRRCNEHGGLSATILATMPTFRDLGHDEKSNQKYRRAILTAIRYRDNPTSIPANCDPLGKDIYEALHKAQQNSLINNKNNNFKPSANQIKKFKQEIHSFFNGILKELDLNPANINKESDGVYLGGGVILVSLTKLLRRYSLLLTPKTRGNFKLWEVDGQEHVSWPYFIDAIKDIGTLKETWEDIKPSSNQTFNIKANNIQFTNALFIQIDRENFTELRQQLDTYPEWKGVIEIQKTKSSLIEEVNKKSKIVDDMIKNVYEKTVNI